MIRPATPSDVPAIHALIHALARYERLEHEAVATEEQIRASLFGAGAPHAEALVAENDAASGGANEVAASGGANEVAASGGANKIVAFALFFHNYSTFLGRRGVYLEDLFVLPEHRRQGHGTALLRALARVAVERGCGRLEWAVLQWNEPAIRFYRSLGALELEDWRILRVTGAALERLASG